MITHTEVSHDVALTYAEVVRTADATCFSSTLTDVDAVVSLNVKLDPAWVVTGKLQVRVPNRRVRTKYLNYSPMTDEFPKQLGYSPVLDQVVVTERFRRTLMNFSDTFAQVMGL